MMKRIEIEYEVFCGDECLAVTSGEGAEQEALNYASAYGAADIYELGGEVRVYQVTKIYERIR